MPERSERAHAPDVARFQRDTHARTFYERLNTLYSGEGTRRDETRISYVPRGAPGALEQLASSNASLLATVVLRNPDRAQEAEKGVVASIEQTLRVVGTFLADPSKPAQSLKPALTPLERDLVRIWQNAGSGRYVTRGEFAADVQRVLDGSAAQAASAIRTAKADV